RKVTLELDETAKTWLGNKGYDPAYGARPLKRVIQKYVQDPLAEQILQGTIIANEKSEIEGPSSGRRDDGMRPLAVADPVARYLTDDQKRDLVANLRAEMLEASENLEFERAAELRDSITQLEAGMK
ncbi:MAG: UvrB/UvrC motif-containing protein, partial [Rhodothermales bacterium]|nr:UvrB/UvrC motif-containing protein [Rhodothermales bacterium]